MPRRNRRKPQKEMSDKTLKALRAEVKQIMRERKENK